MCRIGFSGLPFEGIQKQYCNYGPCLNPYKLNGISHSYQLDQSISILRIVGRNFSFLFRF